jgi:membrane protein YdbS with pleckstrin-like domain
MMTSHQKPPTGETPQAGGHAEAATAAPGQAQPLAPTGGLGKQAAENTPETDLWTGRTHWKYFASLLVRAGLIYIVVAVALWQAASRQVFAQPGTAWWIALAVAAVIAVYAMGRIGLTILNERYRLTTQRLFIERGILSQTVDQVELVRVDDVRISKSFLNRIFGVGTVSVMTTDASDRSIRITGVLGPESVAESIRTHVRAVRQRSLYVEHV